MAPVRSARRSPLTAALIVALVAASAVLIRQQVALAGSNLPADKMTVTASKMAVIDPGAPGLTTPVQVLNARMKTSSPADILLQLTSECAILSNITNAGTQTSNYSTIVRLWITVDNKPVPVVPPASTTGASGGGGSTDNGKVVFCNRELTRSTTFQSNSESITDVERTEQANAFNWVAMNVGNGIHDIVVWAEFENSNSTDAMSHGVIDKRSLTAEVTNYFISQPSA